MKSFLNLSFLLTFFLVLLVNPILICAEEQKFEYEIQPNNTLNPGETYTVKIQAYDVINNPCKNCAVKVNFQGDPQPLDTIEPAEIITSPDGIAYINATSYVTEKRQLFVKIISPKQESFTKTIDLSYQNNPLLSVINSIKKVADIGIPFPPLGNVYPIATKQRYSGGQTRIVFIKLNAPFGTKLFKISLINGENRQLIKITKDTEISVDISAFKDVNIGIQACSTSKGDDISCVGPFGLLIPKITEPIENLNAIELPVPNGGSLDSVSPKDRIKKEEAEIESNPFSRFFKTVYSFYK